MNDATPQLYNGPVPGLWNDGQSAASHSVTLFFRPHAGEVRVCTPGAINDVHPMAVWHVSRIRVLSGKLSGNSSSPLRLAEEPDSGQRLTVQGRGELSSLSAWMRDSQAGRRAKVRKRWLMGMAAVWAICIALYVSSPFLFSFAAGTIPQRWEEGLGKSSRDSIVDILARLSEARPAADAAGKDPGLQSLLTRLENGAPCNGYSFDLIVLDADFVNAFALPGGYMLVSTGLIKACETPDELAGVLAHEMAHVTERHGTGRLLRERAWAFFVRLMSGGGDLAAQLAGALVTTSFDRDDEREADAKGVARLAGAGINPMGLAEFFARLEKEDTPGGSPWILSYLASHPELPERRENIRTATERAAENGAAPFSPAMTGDQWRHFRTMCGIQQ